MNDQTQVADPAIETHGSSEREHFFPAGAIAFFVLLVLLCVAFWFGIYSLMIQRS